MKENVVLVLKHEFSVVYTLNLRNTRVTVMNISLYWLILEGILIPTARKSNLKYEGRC